MKAFQEEGSADQLGIEGYLGMSTALLTLTRIALVVGAKAKLKEVRESEMSQ